MLTWLYPQKCIACRTILPPTHCKTAYLCEHCEPIITPISQPVCPRCGIPFSIERTDVTCLACSGRRFYFESHRALFPYKDAVQEMLKEMKFRSHKRTAVGLGAFLAKACKDWQTQGYIENADYIVPVPLHPSKKRKRGFNQAEELAKSIAKELNVPMAHPVIRVRKTQAQSGLTTTARENNLRGAFEYNSRFGVIGKKILLVDDIFTTGATMNACAQVLLESGAKSVACVSLSIALKKS